MDKTPTFFWVSDTKTVEFDTLIVCSENKKNYFSSWGDGSHVRKFLFEMNGKMYKDDQAFHIGELLHSIENADEVVAVLDGKVVYMKSEERA